MTSYGSSYRKMETTDAEISKILKNPNVHSTTTYTLLPYAAQPYHDTTLRLDGSSYKKELDRCTRLSHHGRPCISFSGSKCDCLCSCCISEPLQLDELKTYDLSIHARNVRKKQEELWNKIMSNNKDSSASSDSKTSTLHNAKVIGIDRKDIWQPTEHTMYCEDRSCYCNSITCKDRFCVCRCKCCLKSLPIKDDDDDDRCVYEWWLYYAKQLQIYIDDKAHPRHKKILLTIDPWSLQQLWYCRPCNRYSVVEVYNNRGYYTSLVFHVCLGCFNMYDLMVTPQLSYLTLVGKYDLC